MWGFIHPPSRGLGESLDPRSHPVDSQIGPAGGERRRESAGLCLAGKEVTINYLRPRRPAVGLCLGVLLSPALTLSSPPFPRCPHPADVYSFGIIMWEMLTWQQPYEEMMSVQVKGGDCLGDPWGTCR